MKEKLIIENFGGLEYAEFELRDINILIGPQASGKSVSVKLMYFFKSFISELFSYTKGDETIRDYNTKQKQKFLKYFPKSSWKDKKFKLQYLFSDNYQITIHKNKSNSASVIYSDDFKKLIKESKNVLKKEYADNHEFLDTVKSLHTLYMHDHYSFIEYFEKKISTPTVNNQYFIPAGRSFFSNIQSTIFTLLSQNNSIDPFLLEFGAIYENYKKNIPSNLIDDSRFDKLTQDVLKGVYVHEKNKQFILHKDNRKIELSLASSGQQEILPLLLILKRLNSLANKSYTLYIEEPEAHLFPTAQKRIIQLLARIFNSSDKKPQIIITSHSPYTLSAFNNLLEAGKTIKNDPKKAKKVYKIIPKKEILSPENLIAYSVANGKTTSLINPETQLISDNVIDEVSDEIALEFGKLLDIAY